MIDISLFFMYIDDMSSKKITTSEIKTTKRFSYKKGEINLDFSLFVDFPNDLETYRELLEMALKDIHLELSKFNK